VSVVAVFNQKGGVGKTTTTFNLTAALARVGRRPVAIDLDPQAHLSLALGVRHVTGAQSVFGFFERGTPLGMLARETPLGIQLVPAAPDLSKIDTLYGSDPGITRRLSAGIDEAGWRTKAPVMIDCSPMLGVLTLNALMAADQVLIPLSADYLSLQGVYRISTALDVLEKKAAKRFLRRIVLSRYDARRKLSFQIYRELQDAFPGILCETRIHESVALAESPMHAKDIFTFAPSSQGATDFRLLVQELDAAAFFAGSGCAPDTTHAAIGRFLAVALESSHNGSLGETTMKRPVSHTLFAALLTFLSISAFANLGGDDSSKSDDADFVTGRRAIDALDWPGAVAAMQKAISADPRNADAYNWLGYAQRKQGNYDAAFKAYGEALRLNPRSKSVHEYIGEAYLATKQLAKAEEHLAELNRLCSPIPCEELKDLRRAIDDFKKKNK